MQHVFNWSREALLAPLEAGSTVISLSSGAALRGSPVSGGYAGSKATIRFIASYAAEESEREQLGIRFTSVLPNLNPATELGATGAAAYARRAGTDLRRFLQDREPPLSLDQIAAQIIELATDAERDQPAYLLTPAGLSPAP